MKVLVINPIMYTSETKNIKRAASIKDTMMYDFCLAFHEMGHSVTLVGGEPFKPTKSETYPFEVLWWKCKCQKVCMPHCLPFMPETYQYVKQHCTEYDLIITSEVFSLNSLMAYRVAPDKTIIWHELAKHNAIMKKIPSKIWYGVIARIFMRNAKVVARSVEARNFVKKYCMNTDVNVIDHGVNLDKFKASAEKDNSFVVCSQLIERKKIDGILEKFAMYLNQYNSTCRLYIIGEGELKEKLQRMAQTLGIAPNVIFTGKMTHDELLPILSKSKALLVNTVKDNNMISIVEAIAVGTPIVTTDVPLNSTYIKDYQLGIAKKQWDESDLNDVVSNSEMYIELESTVILYAVLSALVGLYVGKTSILSIIKAFIPVSTNCYWFISCYILLMIFSPYINRAIDSMSELQYRQLLLLMSAVFLVAPTVIYYSVLGGGKNVINMLLLYFLGSYIRKYSLGERFDKKSLLKILIATTALNVSLNSLISIATGGKPHIPFARDCSIFIAIEAVALMMFFMKVEFHSNFINRVAKHVFAVYLFEGAFRQIMQIVVFDYSIYEGEWYWPLVNIAVALIAMVGCMLIDVLFQTILNPFRKIALKMAGTIIKKLKINLSTTNV